MNRSRVSRQWSPEEARQLKIVQLSRDWRVALPPAPVRLERPQQPPTFRQPADDHTAEALLQRRALEIAQVRPKSGLSRAFSTNNLKKGKGWEPTHILEVLTGLIAEGGSPAVAESLMVKLSAAGFDMSAMQQHKSGLLARRRSIDGFSDRTKLLKLAVQGDQLEMAQLLAPYADPISLDTCLPIAIRAGNTPIAEVLIRYGASIGQTAEGQDAFRQVCSIPMLADMVRLIVQSEGPPSAVLASQAMVDAVRASSSLETVFHLSRSVADGDYNEAEALRLAVGMQKRDVALAIVMGNRPPRTEGVNRAMQVLLETSWSNAQLMCQVTELLLYAGAQGDILQWLLQRSIDYRLVDITNLLVSHGVSVVHGDASVLKTAVGRCDVQVVSSLVHDRTNLPAELAAACISLIPRHATVDDRYFLVNLFLRKGATGQQVDEMLILAANDGDFNLAQLLLQPGAPNGAPNGATSPTMHSPGRPPMASPDYKDGEALRTAVVRVDKNMTKAILAGHPSAATLSKVFPLTRNLAASDRYDMVDIFLHGGLSGPVLHAMLQTAIEEDPSTRDDSLIKLLLANDADINYNHGYGLRSIIQQADLHFLETLMQRASPQTAAARIPDAMSVADHRARHGIMSYLFRIGAAVGVDEVAAALLTTLEEKAVDMSLLQLVLQQGGANVNSASHPILARAIANPDPKVLELVLLSGKPSAANVTQGLQDVVALPSTEAKTAKMRTLLSKSTTGQDDLGSLLVNEVQAFLKTPSKSTLSTTRLLLDAGADPNSYKAAALCHAVAAANTPLTELLFESPSKPILQASIGFVLPHALHIADPMDRLAFTKKLIAAGPAPLEANRALVFSTRKFIQDVALLGVLASAADASDGEALTTSVAMESPEAVDVVLSRSARRDPASNDMALDKAMQISDRAIRQRICRRLLTAGVSTEVASNALLISSRDGDLELSDILMAHGASISSNNGQSIVEACRGGSVEVVEVLLRASGGGGGGGGGVHKATIERGFQAATEVGDLNKRAVIFEKLLRRGVSGEAVDAQLLSAARYGEQGHEVLRVLLAAGADPNYNNGEAVVAATSSAFVRNLELLLGLWDDDGAQKRASGPTLIRALKASWSLNDRDTRIQIIRDLMRAGLPVTDDVHMALNDAVNEEDPDEMLVQLLLDHGASPVANDGKTLVDASRKALAPCLSLLLEKKPLPEEAISRAFAASFTQDNLDTWFTEAGRDAMEILVDHGAGGQALNPVLVSVMRRNEKHTDETTRSLADEFVTLLTAHDPDVNYNDGEALQVAASQANVEWTRLLLACRPTGETLAFAFHHIFDTVLDEEDALALFEMFAEYRDGETTIDVMTQKPGAEPVLVRAMSQYPRSTRILRTLLDAGYYHDQSTVCQLYPTLDEVEEVTVLTWALAQPQKRISSSLIQLLVDRGAKINVSSPKSHTTPLMLAIQARRPDIVKLLLLEGADVNPTDYLDRSALSMATDIGGDTAIGIMGSLLAADPNPDDGSLHNAARELNLPAVKVLLQGGHDPDFPSTYHDGRSALAEVCLRGADVEMTAERERTMQKVMAELIKAGSDVGIRSDGKCLLHLCFESADPVTTTRIFLKGGMWKYINKPLFQYTDHENHLTYSPTMYISKVLPMSDHTEPLLKLLRANRASDVFYASEGAQPEGAVGLPEDMKVQERERKLRDERQAQEKEDFATAMARKRELASVEGQIWAQRAEMEDARRRKLQGEDVAAVRSRAQLEDSLERAAHQRRLSEQKALADSSAARVRTQATAEIEAEDAKQRRMLEWQGKQDRAQADTARAMSAIRISEREEVDRLERGAEERMGRRLEAQRKVIESQEKLAKRLASNGGTTMDQRRQIGYVSEELN